MKSKLDYETLGKVWNLSDVDLVRRAREGSGWICSSDPVHVRQVSDCFNATDSTISSWRRRGHRMVTSMWMNSPWQCICAIRYAAQRGSRVMMLIPVSKRG